MNHISQISIKQIAAISKSILSKANKNKNTEKLYEMLLQIM